jgi:hypothetical protein
MLVNEDKEMIGLLTVAWCQQHLESYADNLSCLVTFLSGYNDDRSTCYTLFLYTGV